MFSGFVNKNLHAGRCRPRRRTASHFVFSAVNRADDSSQCSMNTDEICTYVMQYVTCAPIPSLNCGPPIPGSFRDINDFALSHPKEFGKSSCQSRVKACFQGQTMTGMGFLRHNSPSFDAGRRRPQCWDPVVLRLGSGRTWRRKRCMLQFQSVLKFPPKIYQHAKVLRIVGWKV